MHMSSGRLGGVAAARVAPSPAPPLTLPAQHRYLPLPPPRLSPPPADAVLQTFM